MPLAVLAVFIMLELWKTQQSQLHESVHSTASALAAVVDENVGSSMRHLELLAEGATLGAQRFAEFHARVQAILPMRKDWRAIILVRASDRAQILNTNRPFGEALPPAVDRPYLEEVIREGQPVVSKLFVGRVTGDPVVDIAVPVMRDRQVAYILIATVDTSALSSLLRERLRGQPGIAGIVDEEYRIIARTRDPEAFLGKTLVPALDAAVRRSREGIGRFPVADAPPTYTAWAPIGRTGWTLVMGMPAGPVDAALWRSLVLFGGLLAVLLAASAFAAWYLARHIARSIEGAAQAADTMGAGQVVPAAASRIREIEALNAALHAASQRLAGARTEARGLANVAAALSGTLELRRMLQAVAEEAQRVTRSDLVRIALPSGNPGEMIYRYLVGTRAAGYDAIRPREGRGFVGHVMQTRKPYRTADAPNDPLVKTVRGRNTLAEEGTRSALVVPILEQGELQGVIYAGRRKVEPFTDDEESTCMRLAAQAALALRNARLYERAQAAREEAEAASRAKDEFLAMLSHELRNPLGAISMAAHLLQKLPLPEQAGSAQKIIARQSAHLGKILDDLLDVGGAISGKVALRRQRIELGAVVRAAITHFEAPERGAGPRLTLDAEAAWVDADPARIEQIVVNLVGNAVKFTPEGGEIQVRVRPAGGQALIEVRDNGIGIPPAMLERIFDLFAQAHAEPARGRGGLGIGLTITRRLVELHGGSIGVESTGEGRGACFTVRLPLVPAPERHTTQHAAAEPPGEKLDLIVVEDNADARDTLARYLELAGNSVRACTNGAEALAAVAARVPDAAILDVGLPDCDGYVLAAKLRERHGGRMVLAALTGYGQTSDRLRAEQAGFDTHFTKPVEPDRMLHVLQGLARRRA